MSRQLFNFDKAEKAAKTLVSGSPYERLELIARHGPNPVNQVMWEGIDSDAIKAIAVISATILLAGGLIIGSIVDNNAMKTLENSIVPPPATTEGQQTIDYAKYYSPEYINNQVNNLSKEYINLLNYMKSNESDASIDTSKLDANRLDINVDNYEVFKTNYIDNKQDYTSFDDASRVTVAYKLVSEEKDVYEKQLVEKQMELDSRIFGKNGYLSVSSEVNNIKKLIDTTDKALSVLNQKIIDFNVSITPENVESINTIHNNID